jgi:hypothetical protein
MAGIFRPALVIAAVLVGPASAIAQTYGTENTPGGVEAKPSAVDGASRSLKSPAPAAPTAPSLESTVPDAPAAPESTNSASQPADRETENTNRDAEPK